MITGAQNLGRAFSFHCTYLFQHKSRAITNIRTLYIASNSKNRSQRCLMLRQTKALIKASYLCKCSTTATQLRSLMTSLSKKLLSSLQYKTDSMLLLQYPNTLHHPKTCSNRFCFVPLRVLQTRAHGGTHLEIKDKHC